MTVSGLDEYDAAQARGEVAGPKDGKLGRSNGERPTTAADIGLPRKEIHEARKIRDAEKAENEVRQDFTASERVAIAEAVKEALGERRGTNQHTSEDVKNFGHPVGTRTGVIAAERAGFGNPETLRQAKAVIAKGVPELVQAMDSGKVSISAAAVAREIGSRQGKRTDILPDNCPEVMKGETRDLKLGHDGDEVEGRENSDNSSISPTARHKNAARLTLTSIECQYTIDKNVEWSYYCAFGSNSRLSLPQRQLAKTPTKGRQHIAMGTTLPFITDQTWTPETYRLAKRAWDFNAPDTDGKITKRKAKIKSKPKHGDLSRRLRSLMTWRAMTAGSDWTLMPDNDNDDTGRKKRMNTDCITEVRPLPEEIMSAVDDADVQIIERKSAKLGGGGEIVRIVEGNDVTRGKVECQGKRKPDCITTIGRLQFSNGGNTERAPVLDAAGKPRMGDVRLPLGALMKVGPHRLRYCFRRPKGAPRAVNDNALTVGASLTATEHAVDFNDPISDAQERERIRNAVGWQTADILDHALVAANFSEIGERLGFIGKTAERRGKAALLAACQVLEKELAAAA